MFLKIPDHTILDFDFAKFCDHVLDTSPAFQTRSQLRKGITAREAIAAASNGVAEIPDDVAEAWQTACAEAPIPRLQVIDKASGVTSVVANRAYEPFYAAVERMTKELIDG